MHYDLYGKAHGGEIVFDESIDFSKDTDFQTIMTNALKTNPERNVNRRSV